jgi:hypothetical protein
VVEHDPLIALDLKATLEHAGMLVLGPASRVADAMLLAEKSLPVAAVLDVRLEVGPACLSLNGWPHGTFRFCFRQVIRLLLMPHILPSPCCASRSGPSSSSRRSPLFWPRNSKWLIQVKLRA